MAQDESSIKLNDVLPAIDRKDRDWWSRLNPSQKDKFPSWLYMRYAASVQGDPDLSRYYLMAINETVNKRFNTLRNHQQLQYLLMTAASPGMGSQRHGWIPPTKRGKMDKKVKLLNQIFPQAKPDEVEALAMINDDIDIIRELEDRGWSDKDIKAAMKGKDE